MVSSGGRELSKKVVKSTLLWRQVTGEAEENEDEQVDELDDEQEDGQRRKDPQKQRRKRQAPVESDSRDSGDQGKESPSKNKKRKKAAALPPDEGSDAEQTLLTVIRHSPKRIPHVVKNWVERYEAEPEPALCELLTCIFEACGMKFSAGEDLVHESVDEVVLKLVNQAKTGDAEDYITSKQKEFRSFKDNLGSFWDAFVIECQDGPLFDDKLMEKCMDYITVLACSPPRNFRHVSTIIGLQLVTSFITVAKTLCQSRETKQRQLNAEQRKRKDSSRIQSLNKVLSETHSKITKLEEMMRKLYTGLFMHRYRDVDAEIRMTCIRAAGSWIVSYPSLFLEDKYLKYLGWTLNDKDSSVRKSSVDALQALYAVDDNLPSLKLFTTRFSARMMELANDVDVGVSVAAIGLIKQLLRHQRTGDTESLEVTPLYDLLIDESPQIRHAIGQLVYEQMIVMHGADDEDNEKPEVQLKRLLTILREFSGDSILCTYVIDAIWDDMKTMQNWKCLMEMLLDDSQDMDLDDTDLTNLCTILCASAKRAVSGKIISIGENRKPAPVSKSQKEALETSKRRLTNSMIKNLAKLLRKFLADISKVSHIVEVIQYLNLELYSLKQQQETGIATIELVKEAFFKHGDKTTLRTCVETLAFCVNDNEGELRDAAQRILKETTDEVILKLRSAIDLAGETEDDYSLTVNLRRMQHLQLSIPVPGDEIFKNMTTILEDFTNLDDEVVQLLLLNMFLHILWSFKALDHESPNAGQVESLSSKTLSLLKYLESYTDMVIESFKEGSARCSLCSTICTVFSDFCSMFGTSKLSSTQVERLGYTPSSDRLQRFWELCECRLSTLEEEEAEEGEAEMSQKDIVVTSAAKLVVHDVGPKDFLAPEIISQYLLHGRGVEETVKQLVSHLKKTRSSSELCSLFLEAVKQAYERCMDEENKDLKAQYLTASNELAIRLSGSFSGVLRNVHKAGIIKHVKKGFNYVFDDAPGRLMFLESCLLPFCLKLSGGDIRELISELQLKVADDVDTEQPDWQPFRDFIAHLQERLPGQDQSAAAGKQGKKRGKMKQSDTEEEEQQSQSEDIEDDDDTPLYHSSSKANRAGSKADNAHTMRTRHKAAAAAAAAATTVAGSAPATEEQLPL